MYVGMIAEAGRKKEEENMFLRAGAFRGQKKILSPQAANIPPLICPSYSMITLLFLLLPLYRHFQKATEVKRNNHKKA